MNNDERCTCGDTGSTFHPDENQYEANCWDCYYQMQDYHNYDDDHKYVLCASYLPEKELTLAQLTDEMGHSDGSYW